MATPVAPRITAPPELQPYLLNSLAKPAPPGETVDLDNPENLHIYLLITLILGVACTTLTLAARIYTKCFIIRKMGWEDYTVIVGWLLFLPFCAEIFVAVPYAGVHIWNTRVGDLLTLLHLANTVEILYLPAIAFIKVSILLQYLRIFAPTRKANPAMWYGAHIVMWTNVLFYSIKMMIDIFACHPRDLQWNPFISGSCLNTKALIMTVAVFNLVSDVIIFLLPQYSIRRLKMGRQRKIGVAAVFGVGLLACVVAALRIQSTLQLTRTEDESWYLAGLALWAIAEISLAIISSSLPTIPRLINTAGDRISKRFSLDPNQVGLRVSKTPSTEQISYRAGEKDSQRSRQSSVDSRPDSLHWPKSLYSDSDDAEQDWSAADEKSLRRNSGSTLSGTQDDSIAHMDRIAHAV